MISKYIDLIIAPLFKRGLLWAQESFVRICISVIALVALLVLAIASSKWIEFGNLYLLFSGFSLKMTLLFPHIAWITFVLVFGVNIYLIWKDMRPKTIKIKIKKNSKVEDYFIVPPGSDWSLIPDEKSLENVLSVTNSGLTGHLIKGNEWHNYNLSFKVKIINSNFTFAVRTIDKNNCIFFQCGNTSINPHLVVSGIFIRNFKNMTIPIEIPKHTWVNVSALVEGNKVIISINGVKREFDIPRGPWFIEKDNLKVVLEYVDIVRASKEALGLNDYIRNQSGIISDEDNLDDIARKLSANMAKVKLEKYHIFNYDFDRGTIGFRESWPEHALYRDIKVELLDKI